MFALLSGFRRMDTITCIASSREKPFSISASRLIESHIDHRRSLSISSACFSSDSKFFQYSFNWFWLSIRWFGISNNTFLLREPLRYHEHAITAPASAEVSALKDKSLWYPDRLHAIKNSISLLSLLLQLAAKFKRLLAAIRSELASLFRMNMIGAHCHANPFIGLALAGMRSSFPLQSSISVTGIKSERQDRKSVV